MRLTVIATVVLMLLALGCTIKTQITEPDGSVYTIQSKSDSMVTMRNGGLEIIVDNKGKPNIFESLLGWVLLKTPDVMQAK